MVMTQSAPATALAVLPAAVPPASANRATAAVLTSWPCTAWPALSRLHAMGRPMWPSPKNPIVAISPS